MFQINYVLLKDLNGWGELIYERFCDQSNNYVTKESLKAMLLLSAQVGLKIIKITDFIIGMCCPEFFQNSAKDREWLNESFLNFFNDDDGTIINHCFTLMSKTSSDAIPRDEFIKSIVDESIQNQINAFTLNLFSGQLDELKSRLNKHLIEN